MVEGPKTYLGILYHHVKRRWRKGVTEFFRELGKQGIAFS
jgi:hypothetical protein